MFYVVRFLVVILAILVGWMPFFGKWPKKWHMANEFEQMFGFPWWRESAPGIAAQKLKDLEQAWKETGYDPKANKKYAHCQKVAGYLDELRA